jgi:hypothetical protein
MANKKKIKKKDPKPDNKIVPVLIEGPLVKIPASEEALPIPMDAKTNREVEKVVQLSFLDYLKALNKAYDKDTSMNVIQLHNILSEYLGPYILIGYSPNDEPIEMFGAQTTKEKEALLERLRKTFIRHMSMNAP